MSSADILAFPHSEPFPPAQVLDLAVSVAIGRDLARSETEMFALIKDWFLRPATVGELAASIKRLLDCGSITRVSDGEGTVMIFVCGRAVDHQADMALMKRSPKITANCAFAIVHSRGGIFHSFSDLFKIR